MAPRETLTLGLVANGIIMVDMKYDLLTAFIFIIYVMVGTGKIHLWNDLTVPHPSAY